LLFGSLAAGTILFGGIACVWRAVLRDRVRSSNLLYVGVLSALLAIALHATFDFPLQLISLQLYVATYLGIAWATFPSYKVQTRESEPLQAAREA